MFFPERILSIKATDRVLEIGPGATPHPRADEFLELRYENAHDQFEQNGKTGFLKTEKTVHFYDGGRFPFEDRAFDYVICSHVLEHVPNVPGFLSELTRIAPAGYLEFPSPLYDYLYGFDVHLNLLTWNGNEIRWALKSETSLHAWKPLQDVLRRTFENGSHELVRSYLPWFVHGFEWFETISHVHTLSLNIESQGLPPLISTPVPARPPLAQGSPLDSLRTLWHRISRPPAPGEPDADYRQPFLNFLQRATINARGFNVDWNHRKIVRGEDTATTMFDPHYTYHPAWAFRKLMEIRPARHIDFSSILSFSAQLSAVIPTRFYDWRPAPLFLPGLDSGRADLTALDLPDHSEPSVSCMHVIEHIGLGRYGDPIDFDGDLKALHELQRIVAPGGVLLLVVPVGRPVVVFNAHRVYSFEQIDSRFTGWERLDFSLIPDNAFEKGMVWNADPMLVQQQQYGCGCFLYRKRSLPS